MRTSFEYYLLSALLILLVHASSSQVNNETNEANAITSATASIIATTTTTTTTFAINKPMLRVKRPLSANYTRRPGERLRLECEFELVNHQNEIGTDMSVSDDEDATDPLAELTPQDFTLYWVKNYQELVQTRKGVVHVIRKNMSIM
jgi:hypothetical protein